MNKIGKMINKSMLITLIAVTVALILSIVAIGTYAAYTNSRNAQRTVATDKAHGERFSSNVLRKGNSRDNVKTIYVTEATSLPTQIVTVSNYEHGKQNSPNSEEIVYVVTVRLVKYDASTDDKYVPVDAAYMTANSLTGYTVNVTRGSTTVTLSSSHLSDASFVGTLEENVASSDVYTLEFSNNFAPNKPNLYVEMIVTPQNVGLQIMRAVFKTDMRAAGASNAWTGSFTDDTEAGTPSEYDGYNYSVAGVGSGTVTLTWDATKVALSDLSISKLLSITGATKTGSSITFAVNSGVESRYDLQFYKVNITTETWSVMNSTVVTFSFA